jgi:hypothetical protein
VRRLVLGIAAISVFMGIAVLVLTLATRSGPPAWPRENAAQEATPAPAQPVALPSALPGATRLDPPPPPMIQDAPPPRPARDSWEAVPAVARPAALGPLGGAIGRGLLELQPRISACFDEDTQARFGQQGYTAVKDYAPMDDHGSTILVLQVETLAGAARIVDAPVETRGGASDGLIACVQRVLRGHSTPVPQAQPGARYRILYPVTR